MTKHTDSKYINSDNGQLLESILKKNFKNTGITEKEATHIAHHQYQKGNEARVLVKWCYDSAKEYIQVMEGLCKVELECVGSIILDVDGWRFEDNILKKGLNDWRFEDYFPKEKGSKEITQILGYAGYKKGRVGKFMESIGYTVILKYPEMMTKNNRIWFIDEEKCKKYVEKTLVEEYYDDLSKKKFKKEIKKGHIILPRNIEDKIINHPSENLKTITPQTESTEIEFDSIGFAKKYELDEESFKNSKHTEINPTEIDRALFNGGLLIEPHRRLIKSTIVRNYKFGKVFHIAGKEGYSQEKIKHIGTFYASANYTKREEFWKDLEKVFGIKK